MSTETGVFNELDDLRLLGLSRIPRCARCDRLKRLREVRETGRDQADPLPPVPVECRHQVCKPLIIRITGAAVEDGADRRS